MYTSVCRDTLAVLEQNAQRIVELETEASALEKALEANGGKESARHRTVGDPYYESDESFMTGARSPAPAQVHKPLSGATPAVCCCASSALPMRAPGVCRRCASCLIEITTQRVHMRGLCDSWRRTVCACKRRTLESPNISTSHRGPP